AWLVTGRLRKQFVVWRSHGGAKYTPALHRVNAFLATFATRVGALHEAPAGSPTLKASRKNWHEIRPGYRRSVCGVDSIYYRVGDDLVEISWLISSRDPARHQHRLRRDEAI